MFGLVLSRKATETPRMGSAGARSTPERKEGPAAARVLIAMRVFCGCRMKDVSKACQRMSARGR